MISFKDFINEKHAQSINESKLLFTMYGEEEDGHIHLQSFGFTYNKIDFEIGTEKHGEAIYLSYWKNKPRPHSEQIIIKDKELFKEYQKHVDRFYKEDLEETEFHDSKLEKLILKHLEKETLK